MTASARRIGILGGTFDPIHLGHLGAAEAARDALGLDQVWLLPVNVPPHRPSAPDASPADRFAMAALAAAELKGLVASDLELAHAGRSYTAATLGRLHRAGWRPTELFFITGADAFAEIASWRDYPAILDLCHFVVIARPGYPFGELRDRLPDLALRMRTPGAGPGPDEAAEGGTTRVWLVEALTPDVSSTLIRERIRDRRSLEGLVPHAVEEYILGHGLYAGEERSQEAGGTRMTTEASPVTPRDAGKVPASIARAVAAALDKKAADLVLLDLRPVDAFTDYFLICTGQNERQVRAIADAVEAGLREEGLKAAHVEGHERADWVLIDYFDFIVHVFQPEPRTFYALERLWGSATRLDLPPAAAPPTRAR